MNNRLFISVGARGRAGDLRDLPGGREGPSSPARSRGPSAQDGSARRRTGSATSKGRRSSTARYCTSMAVSGGTLKRMTRALESPRYQVQDRSRVDPRGRRWSSSNAERLRSSDVEACVCQTAEGTIRGDRRPVGTRPGPRMRGQYTGQDYPREGDRSGRSGPSIDGRVAGAGDVTRSHRRTTETGAAQGPLRHAILRHAVGPPAVALGGTTRSSLAAPSRTYECTTRRQRRSAWYDVVIHRDASRRSTRSTSSLASAGRTFLSRARHDSGRRAGLRASDQDERRVQARRRRSCARAAPPTPGEQRQDPVHLRRVTPVARERRSSS